MKEDYDGAEPSASSVGAWNLLSLAHLTGDDAYAARAAAVFAAFAARLSAQGRALPMLAAALSISLAPAEQIVVVGAAGDAEADTLWRAAQRRYRPFMTLLRVAPGERQTRLGGLIPWVASMTPVDGRAAAYVCRNFTCEAPTTRAEDVA